MKQSDRHEDIQQALEVLRKGGIILYPTDTVWGIGCDASRPEAVKRIFELKKRADSKSMIVLLDDVEKLERYAEIPEVASELFEAAVDPMTIIYDGAASMARELIAEDGSVGIRVTKEEISASLCRGLRRPLVSTSANISGQPTPMSFNEISQEIINGVDYVMKSRRDETDLPKPSTIIRLRPDGRFAILRK